MILTWVVAQAELRVTMAVLTFGDMKLTKSILKSKNNALKITQHS